MGDIAEKGLDRSSSEPVALEELRNWLNALPSMTSGPMILLVEDFWDIIRYSGGEPSAEVLNLPPTLYC